MLPGDDGPHFASATLTQHKTSETNDLNELCITNIEPGATEGSIRRMCTQFGSVLSVSLVDRQAALVQFASPSAAACAKNALDKKATGQDQEASIFTSKSPLAEMSVESQSKLNNAGQIVQIDVPRDPSLKCRIDTVAKLVAMYGSPMEQAAELEGLDFIHKSSGSHSYYLFKVIENGYILRGLRPPEYVRVERDNLTLYLPLAPREDSTVAIPTFSVKTYFERLDFALQCMSPQWVAPDPQVALFTANLKTLDRHDWTIKALTVEALKINKPIVIHLICNGLLVTKELEQKVAFAYLIHNILCNVTANAAVQWKLKPDAFYRLPQVVEHLFEVCQECSAVKGRILDMLDIWRVCSVFPDDFLDGLDYTFFGQDCKYAPEPDTPKNLIVQSHDGEPLEDEAMTSLLRKMPLAIRREVYDIYKHRDDVWHLRSLCEKNGLPQALRSSKAALVNSLIGKTIYSSSKQPRQINFDCASILNRKR